MKTRLLGEFNKRSAVVVTTTKLLDADWLTGCFADFFLALIGQNFRMFCVNS
jgi:hypothetical protein